MKFNFACRESSISQKIPKNWRELAEVGVARVRKTFKEPEVDVIIAYDKTFIS